VQLALIEPRTRQPGQIALHIRQKDRHPRQRQAFGQGLQGHGLARAGGAGDQPVAIGEPQQQRLWQGGPVAHSANDDATDFGIEDHGHWQPLFLKNNAPRNRQRAF
jgi:hypothetical protein